VVHHIPIVPVVVKQLLIKKDKSSEFTQQVKSTIISTSSSTQNYVNQATNKAHEMDVDDDDDDGASSDKTLAYKSSTGINDTKEQLSSDSKCNVDAAIALDTVKNSANDVKSGANSDASKDKKFY